jgi:hypothetical protein
MRPDSGIKETQFQAAGPRGGRPDKTFPRPANARNEVQPRATDSMVGSERHRFVMKFPNCGDSLRV